VSKRVLLKQGFSAFVQGIFWLQTNVFHATVLNFQQTKGD